MKPAVVFDLDGTLADTVPVIAHHIAETITSFGTLVRPEDVVPFIGRPLEVALAGLTELPDDDPRIEEIITAYRIRWRSAVDLHGETLLLPGARSLLRRLREAGLAVGVVTAKTHAIADHLLVSMGIRDLVDVLVGTDEVPHGKPAPDSALLALKLLNVDAADTWYIGDALSDVAMALAAGMRPLGVTTGACSEEQLREAGAELVVSSPEEIAAIILG